MPLKYTIDRRRRLVFCLVWGCLTYPEACAAREALLNDPEFDPEFDELVDATEQIELRLTSDQARLLASQPIYKSTSKRAWVASKPGMYGMGRLIATHHQMLDAPPTVGVFYNISDAVKWLGLESLTDDIHLGTAATDCDMHQSPRSA